MSLLGFKPHIFQPTAYSLRPLNEKLSIIMVNQYTAIYTLLKCKLNFSFGLHVIFFLHFQLAHILSNNITQLCIPSLSRK